MVPILTAFFLCGLMVVSWCGLMAVRLGMVSWSHGGIYVRIYTPPVRPRDSPYSHQVSGSVRLLSRETAAKQPMNIHSLLADGLQILASNPASSITARRFQTIYLVDLFFDASHWDYYDTLYEQFYYKLIIHVIERNHPPTQTQLFELDSLLASAAFYREIRAIAGPVP